MACPGEPEQVRTTIVGGRPPAGGANVGEIPRGVEVLIKKAAIDPPFKKILLDKRGAAADAIALTLSPAEKAMLEAVPEEQLRAIVANTKVRPSLRPAFLGYAAAAMLAALAANVRAEGTDRIVYKTYGISPTTPPDTAETADVPASIEERAGNDQSDYGKVSGMVTDNEGTPLRNAMVSVVGTKRFAVTNADGYFLITPVPPGLFTVEAFSTEYGSIKRADVKVLAGYTTVLTFQYKNPPLEVPEKPRIEFNTGGYQGIRPDVPSKKGE